MGFRRFLNRQTAAERPTEPVARLAELGRAESPDEREGDHPSSPAGGYAGVLPFADEETRDDAPPVSSVGLNKNPRVSVAREEALDPRSWAAWKRRQSNSIAGIFDMQF